MNSNALFLGLIFSSIGLGYFIYGKKQKMTMPFICGIALMIFPYFIENNLLISAIGMILSLIPWFIRI
ncbi:amino acid transport protein [Acinetobacter bereziniae]|uniref:amino acid transport protein n=1 Tax=Acinetobacter bereziniae TaxID=106648 RepID=UPI001902BFC0|nr:amino acid transport protein [Acinetobacter bereziniae]MBJ8442271.1 amino acid transport protein [Acinetobacter bereziniae]MDV8157832.1 amino acid transport protein [Acinetobacter bereziniae]